MAEPEKAVFQKQTKALAALNSYLATTSPAQVSDEKEGYKANIAYGKGLKTKLDGFVEALGFNVKGLTDNRNIASLLRIEAGARNVKSDSSTYDPRLADLYTYLADAYVSVAAYEGRDAAPADVAVQSLSLAAERAVRHANTVMERNDPRGMLQRGANGIYSMGRGLLALPWAAAKAATAMLPGRNPHAAAKTVADSLYHLPFVGAKAADRMARVVMAPLLLVRAVFYLPVAMLRPDIAAKWIENDFSAVMPRGAAKNVGRALAGVLFAGAWLTIAILTVGVGAALGAGWTAPGWITNMGSAIAGLFVNPLPALTGIGNAIAGAATAAWGGLQAAWGAVTSFYTAQPAVAGFYTAVAGLGAVFLGVVKGLTTDIKKALGFGSSTKDSKVDSKNVFGDGPTSKASNEMKQMQSQQQASQQPIATGQTATQNQQSNMERSTRDRRHGSGPTPENTSVNSPGPSKG